MRRQFWPVSDRRPCKTCSRVCRCRWMWQPGGRLPKPCSTPDNSSRRDRPVRLDSSRSKRNSARCWPTKSSTRQLSLPGARRSPRPICCWNSTGLCVGRSSSKVSTAGRSTPSLYRSTVTSAHSSPLARRCGARRRSSDGVSPTTHAAGSPARFNHSAMNCACATDTQKTRARLRRASEAKRRHSFTTRRARMSLPVTNWSMASRSPGRSQGTAEKSVASSQA